MDKAKHKDTIITIAAGFLVLYFIFDKAWLSYISIGVLGIGILSPALTAYIHKAWFWLADKMGFVMSRVILGISYIFILLPVALLAGIFRKDLMMLRKREKTYYHERNHAYEAKDLEDPW